MRAHTSDFELSSYDYILPPELIAMHPTNPRCDGRLLVYHRESGRIEHRHFRDFCEVVPRDYALVCNDTKVLKARLYASREGGESAREILFHKAFGKSKFLVQIRGRTKVGAVFRICDRTKCPTHFSMRVLEVLDNGLRVVEFGSADSSTPLGISELYMMLESCGHTPLPPYIKREDTLEDSTDYQSVFASNAGAIAAPTASLHFSEEDFARIGALYKVCFVTLHVGAGTFANVHSHDIRAHTMHSESYALSSQARDAILGDSKLLCIGTTTARVVEYFWRTHQSQGLCDLFLHPGNVPQRMDALLTNFHFPKSTLLMLVSAFVGREEVMRIYECAIAHKYKFFSYGDGMLIL
ncbi:tRNA preQ1(34) S-adenosylmethionine ribosyltransferase-isomerase QueA [uncultured Helicobacter sp.]|uniref:tRNA preQ1(34) S-adenosylmethionine ribosyltransferase-isomerase QueA n=1 Tax=uncultured Helicobacter sp. TaxID=175537 RepID=UPI00374EA6DF